MQAYLQARAYEVHGYWIASGLLCLLGGLYLAASGRWVLENLFAPARRMDDEDAAGAGPSP